MYRPRPAVERELQAFHSEDYVQFLQSITPSNKARQQPHEPMQAERPKTERVQWPADSLTAALCRRNT